MTIMIVPISTTAQATSCQMGTGPTARRVSITTGDVKGKIVMNVVKIEKGDMIN